MSIDMSKYLGIFVTEAGEHLEALSRDLVKLEKNASAEALDSMFRHAHSVKGMASSMGYEPIAILAHRAEDVLQAVRDDPKRLDRGLVDLLLSAADALANQVRAASEGRAFPDASALTSELGARVQAMTGRRPEPTRVAEVMMKEGSTAAPVPALPPEPKTEPALGAPPRFSVRFKISPTCAVPGVRGFLVHRRLSSAGNVFDLKPPLEDIKAGHIPDGLVSLEIEATGGEPALAALFKNLSEVELLHIKPIQAGQSAPQAAAAPLTEVPKPVGQEPARTVRVRTELLDYFLDTVGELLLATARIREVGKELAAGPKSHLEEAVDRLHGLVKDLHDKVITVRMTPLALIMDRLPRVARDIARRRERDVDLVVTGAEIELDRAILDELADPMLHLLRNCIDHGIEPPEERLQAGKNAQGRVMVTVRRQRDRVVIDVEDDGRGIDAEKLKSAALAQGLVTAEAVQRMSDREAYLLACLPGVSTAKDVSEISGRGVGMDAVKRAVEGVGGGLEIDSEKGRGTRFTLRLPLTVAVVSLLLVAVGDEIFGLPITKVMGALEADESKLSRSRHAALLPDGSSLLPVHSLAELLRVPAAEPVGVRPFVVMEVDTGKVALAVDRLLGQEEVVLKALSRPLDLVPGLSGVTILGSGRPVFILDVPRLLA
ncbi:MAG TPA: chemotaxis protein CheA [Myxococcaceae bacterium]|nr:chemotaxis protein CheA [Myxococcaceae bacterium]